MRVPSTQHPMDPITLPESWSGLFHAGYRCASHALAPTWVSLWEEWRADYEESQRATARLGTSRSRRLSICCQRLGPYLAYEDQNSRLRDTGTADELGHGTQYHSQTNLSRVMAQHVTTTVVPYLHICNFYLSPIGNNRSPGAVKEAWYSGHAGDTS
ncbi:hypothetical protein NXS19_007373 [Fusarium pseudograminearum]|nr:hypothetical protein NXS19_007373 [Fusarium pseudograminearum]